MKGQASLEQLVVIAAALAFISVAFYFASSYSADSVAIAQAQDAVGRLAAGSDYVYSLGPGSKEYVTIYIPPSVTNISVRGSTIDFQVPTSSGGITDVHATSKASLVGALPAYKGQQKILIEYLQNGKVSLGEAGIACSPELIFRSFNASQSGSDTIMLTNNAAFGITGITAALTGTASEFTTMSSPGSALASEGTETFTVYYNIPTNQSSGTYGGIINVGTGNDGSCITQLTIQVNGVASCPGLCASAGYLTGTCRQNTSMCFQNGEAYVPGNDYTCAATPATPSCCCYPTQDIWGPLAINLGSNPRNATAGAPLTIFAICDDSTTGGSYIASSAIQVDGGAWQAMNANDSAWSHLVAEGVRLNVTLPTMGQHIAGIRCTDTANNTGPISYIYFNLTGADTLGPIITFLNHTSYPTTLTNLTESGSATDMFTGNHNVANCFMKMDGGAWFTPTPADGTYNDDVTEGFNWNFGMLSSGYHTVYAYCIDSLGNIGGVYNDSFGVINVDMMLIMDVSGSMADPVTNAYDTNIASTSSTSLTLVKSIPVPALNGNVANVSTEIRTDKSGCTAYYQDRIGADVIAYGNVTSTSYTTRTVNNANLGGAGAPLTLDIYLNRSTTSGCNAYVRNVYFTQQPTKMQAAQTAATTFVNLVGNSTYAGLVSYSTSATTNRQMATMTAANKNTLINSINGLSPSGSTCIGCGIDNGMTELTSVRSRYPNSTRVEVLMTDGQNNIDPPDPNTEAAAARDDSIIIYTIGFGGDADADQLTNIALLTYGKYYYAPDAATLSYIYSHIGQ